MTERVKISRIKEMIEKERPTDARVHYGSNVSEKELVHMIHERVKKWKPYIEVIVG